MDDLVVCSQILVVAKSEIYRFQFGSYWKMIPASIKKFICDHKKGRGNFFTLEITSGVSNLQSGYYPIDKVNIFALQ